MRTISLWGIILLLFNPKINLNKVSIYNPNLIVAVDNSASMRTLQATNKVIHALNVLKKNEKLHEKFNVEYIKFGSESNLLDSLKFDESETNINTVISQFKPNSTFQQNIILLLSDGNQTIGNDYSYYNGKNIIFPIVFGDTIQYEDLNISLLNVNKFAFLDNQFPVEVFVNYNGKNAVNQVFELSEGENVLFKNNIYLNNNKNSEKISFNLKAKNIGNHYYTAKIYPLNNEKNTMNNQKDFTVEVMNQKSKVLIYSSFLHPDLGALKASIESNRQRSATIQIVNKNFNIYDYQLVILYQPTRDFEEIWNEIEKTNKSFWIITGTKTDWQYLNNMQSLFRKNFSNLKEYYRGLENNFFAEFTVQPFGLEKLPPLQDYFGEITLKTNLNPLLFSKIGNTILEKPLISVFANNDRKSVFIFGEGLWHWKLWSSKEMNSSEPFDNFINTLVHYSSENYKKNQLQLDYEKIFFSNQEIFIKAQYFDKAFQNDTKQFLNLIFKDKKSNKNIKIPFSLQGNEYICRLESLPSGNYDFTVNVLNKIDSRSGSFKVLDYGIENQFYSANYNKLKKLAELTGGSINLSENLPITVNELLQNSSFKNIQKTEKKSTSLINWKWLLIIIIISLSVEWFIRKYRGLI